MGFCLRLLNFCVLIALGGLFLVPLPRLDHSTDARLPGYGPRLSSYSFATDASQERFIAKLASMKAQIHIDVCRRGGFMWLHARDCGSASDS